MWEEFSLYPPMEEKMEIIVGDRVQVDVREEHDREQHVGTVEEIKDYLYKVVFPSGYWQWTHVKRIKKLQG